MQGTFWLTTSSLAVLSSLASFSLDLSPFELPTRNPLRIGIVLGPGKRYHKQSYAINRLDGVLYGKRVKLTQECGGHLVKWAKGTASERNVTGLTRQDLGVRVGLAYFHPYCFVWVYFFLSIHVTPTSPHLRFKVNRSHIL